MDSVWTVERDSVRCAIQCNRPVLWCRLSVVRGCLRSPVEFDARFAYLEKQSQALRGRNLMRDIQVDGAPRVHPAPGRRSRQGPFYCHSRTPELMPQKILGVWGQSPQILPSSITNAGPAFFHDLPPEPGFLGALRRWRRLASLINMSNSTLAA